jgi:hypothetical protein
LTLSQHRQPFRQFVGLYYIGSVGIKKLSKKSKFGHHLQYVSGIKQYQSQTGDGYDLAILGDMGQTFDQLAKYDKFDEPANADALNFTLEYFLSFIKKCEIVDISLAQQQMNMSSSSGFGAKRAGISSRSSPKMQAYLMEYLNLAGSGHVKCVINGSQKDELRVHGKNARFFTSYPPEHTLLSCITLGDFVRQFYSQSFCKNRFVSAIGDAPQKGSMRVYYNELSKRKYAYCTDTSAQDSSVPVWFIRVVLTNIMKKYDLDEIEQNWFDNVISNSIYKAVNVAGYIYLVPRGLGSGDYLTTIINVMWRFYMIVENYKRPLTEFLNHNTVIINGDDLIMSSDFNDLDLSSRYASIKWAGRPVSWEDMDFCSCKFLPDVHYDSLKMRSVLNKRVQVAQILHPESEMQRLGGLLAIHVDESFYRDVLLRMQQIRNEYNLYVEYERNFISYDQLWSAYNIDFEEGQ